MRCAHMAALCTSALVAEVAAAGREDAQVAGGARQRAAGSRATYGVLTG